MDAFGRYGSLGVKMLSQSYSVKTNLSSGDLVLIHSITVGFMVDKE